MSLGTFHKNCWACLGMTETAEAKTEAFVEAVAESVVSPSSANDKASSGMASSLVNHGAENHLENVGSFFSGFMSAASAMASNVTASVASVDPVRNVLTSSTDVAEMDLLQRPEPVQGLDAAQASEKSHQTDGAWRQSLQKGEETAAQWLSSAGKIWDSAVKDVGERLEAAQLDKRVDSLRETSSTFLSDMSKNIHSNLHGVDSNVLRRRADALESSAKDLILSASEQIQSRTKEALEIFVDQENISGAGTGKKSGLNLLGIGHGSSNSVEHVGPAPWDVAALPPAEQGYADAVREHMLKTVLECIYSKKKRSALFLSGNAAKNSFVFDMESRTAEALAVLEADKNVRRLRSGLVPQKINEQEFWNEYFYQVNRARCALVENKGIIPDFDDDNDVDDAALFGDDDDEEEEIAPLEAPVLPPVRKQSTQADKALSDTLRAALPAIADAKASEKAESTAVESKQHVSEGRDWENEIDALFDSEEAS